MHCMEHWAKKFGKIASKHVQNTFGHLWKRLWSILEFWNFFDYFENFRKPDPPWTTGHSFYQKNCHKTCSKQVWTIWQRFWAFLQFWNFSDFFENSRWLLGTLGKKTFSKKSPQNTFGHLETFLDIFGTLKLFWFFPLIFSNSLPQNLGPESWTHIFQVRKTELTYLIWGIWTHRIESRKSEMGLRILTVAWMQKDSLLSIVSENWTPIFKSRKSEMHCMEHWAKKIRKIAPKHVQNMVEHFSEWFWAFLDFWNFLKTRPSMEHWAKVCGKKLPQNMFKTCLHTFGNVLGFFGIFKIFWFFLIFSKARPSMEHGAFFF